MPNSQAYKDFVDALQLAESLLQIEATYLDPAEPKDRKTTEALRGGAAILMVSAFENYLKELVEEYLDELTRIPLRFKSSNLPQEMLFNNWEHLVVAANRQKKHDKVKAYSDMATIIMSGAMSPSSFTGAVRSNPDSEKLGELFRRFGIKDFYSTIKADFEVLWRAPTADTFIQNYLDAILQRRHSVAHTANALNISRYDLQESLRFLKTLGSVCDDHLANHVSLILSPTSSGTP
jgi:RiboL-PSP-HEPN